MKYLHNPPGVNCENVQAVYNDTLAYMADLELNALDDMQYPENKDINARIPRSGYLACFCQQKEDDPYNQKYKVTYPDGKTEDVAICTEWYDEQFYQFIIGNSFSQLLVITNYLLRLLFMWMATYIGYYK